MNDAMRGVILVVAVAALFYATALARAYLTEAWSRKPRRVVPSRVSHHVFWLTCGLAVNAGLAIGTEVDLTGKNDPLIWKEWMRFFAHTFIILGLRPMWMGHKRSEEKRMERAAAKAQKDDQAVTPKPEVEVGAHP